MTIIMEAEAIIETELEFVETFSPCGSEIDYLTEKINEESRALNITSDAYPFAIFLRKKLDKKKSQENYDEIARPSSSSDNMTENRTSKSLEMTTTTTKEGNDVSQIIVGGCNGSVVYGSIYTDQLWVDPKYRGKGLGKMLMEKVHTLGTRKNCRIATVGTMDFQGVLKFYERLGYKIEFEREGYDNNGKMIYLKKNLINKAMQQ